MAPKGNKLFDMIDEANEKLCMFFRQQRREELVTRSGVVMVVDDMPQQADLLARMLQNRNTGLSIAVCPDSWSAINYIKEHGAQAVRIAIVDLELRGNIGNTDGAVVIRWIESHSPDIPYVILTGKSNKVQVLKETYPGIDVLIKGQSSINDYADAIGLVQLDSDQLPLPLDNNKK